MKTRFIMVVLDDEKMTQEAESQEKSLKERGGNATILIEGAFSRAGHVFEIHDVPKMNTGDMTMFTGRFGDDHRERRLRMHINATLYNMATDEWFMVVVATVPRTEHWNCESVATVVKASRRYTDIDLLTESANDSPVVHAVFTGWEAYQQMKRSLLGRMSGRRCQDPDCESCGEGDGAEDDEN